MVSVNIKMNLRVYTLLPILAVLIKSAVALYTLKIGDNYTVKYSNKTDLKYEQCPAMFTSADTPELCVADYRLFNGEINLANMSNNQMYLYLALISGTPDRRRVDPTLVSDYMVEKALLPIMTEDHTPILKGKTIGKGLLYVLIALQKSKHGYTDGQMYEIIPDRKTFLELMSFTDHETCIVLLEYLPKSMVTFYAVEILHVMQSRNVEGEDINAPAISPMQLSLPVVEALLKDGHLKDGIKIGAEFMRELVLCKSGILGSISANMVDPDLSIDLLEDDLWVRDLSPSVISKHFHMKQMREAVPRLLLPSQFAVFEEHPDACKGLAVWNERVIGSVAHMIGPKCMTHALKYIAAINGTRLRSQSISTTKMGKSWLETSEDILSACVESRGGSVSLLSHISPEDWRFIDTSKRQALIDAIDDKETVQIPKEFFVNADGLDITRISFDKLTNASQVEAFKSAMQSATSSIPSMTQAVNRYLSTEDREIVERYYYKCLTSTGSFSVEARDLAKRIKSVLESL